ncbi:hypothetical protein CTI12_AA072420 [Artemisia annua]|uniref:Uncharacterized protein n=1 Tax=Artemisia annua TaxID=35608 RepID=A0A2U1Q5G9_ARTAN|nr:hypothetical protein CTI12_AA072420 [Artemisia annua]
MVCILGKEIHRYSCETWRISRFANTNTATPKKIKEHMKADDITILEFQNHIQTFRKKTNTVDSFVKKREQPSFVDTQDWSQQMIYYFKERWEDEERDKTTTTNDVAIDIHTITGVQDDTNMNKPMPKKRKKANNDIGDKSEGSKRQKYTPWSWEMYKKFIDIVLKLGGCQDATPSKIIQYMKDDNVRISEVQNQFKKFKAKTKRVHKFLIKNKQPPNSETNKWSQEMLYYYQESYESIQGTDNQTPAENKGISKEYIDIGDPMQTCKSCKAKLWKAETKTKGITEEDSFTMCYKKGEVEIPKMANPPNELLELYTGNYEISKRFFHDIRKFNMMYN